MHKEKQQGFTLVEIVVVLSIGAIVLSMVGSMIVFSMNMFASGVGEVQDSISISELQDLLKTELESATEIVITQDSDQLPQGKWNSFAITDANGLTQTITKDDNTTNTISFKDFGSLKDEITLKINLENDTSKGKYAKVTITDDISYVVSLMNAQFNKTNSDVEIKDDMVLYYKKDPRKVAFTDDSSNSGGSTTDPVVPPTTTPETPSVDEIVPPIPDNIDDDSTDYVILNGDFFGTPEEYMSGLVKTKVLKGMILFNPSDGFWYQALEDVYIESFDLSNSRYSWAIKRLTAVYTASDWNIKKRMQFYKGEVIDFEIPGDEGKYKCLNDVHWYGYPSESDWQYYWEKVDDSVPTKIISIPTNLPEKTEGTAMEELKSDLESSKYKFKGEYDSTKHYQVGDIIKITQKAKDGPDYVQYYRKLFNFDAEPGKTDSQRRFAWKLYSRKFSVNSAYEIGDLVWVFKESGYVNSGFYIVQKDYFDADTYKKVGSDQSSAIDWINYNNVGGYFKQY